MPVWTPKLGIWSSPHGGFAAAVTVGALRRWLLQHSIGLSGVHLGTRCADIASWDGMGEGENIPGLHLEMRCRRSGNSLIDRRWRGFILIILMHRRRA